jgi:hypothetical protein
MFWLPIIIAIVLFILGRRMSKRGESKTYILPRGIYENVTRSGRIWRAEYVERVRTTPEGLKLQDRGCYLISLSFVSCIIGVFGKLVLSVALSVAPMFTVSASEHPFNVPKPSPYTKRQAVLHEGETWNQGVTLLTLEHVNRESTCSALLDFDLVVALINTGGVTYARIKRGQIEIRDERNQPYPFVVNDEGFDASCDRYTEDIDSLNFAVHPGYQRRLGIRVLSKEGPKPSSLTVTLRYVEDVEEARWSIPIP